MLKWLTKPWCQKLSKFSRDRRTDGRTDGRTDRRTDGPTDRQTDTPSYRDARTHLKTTRVKVFLHGLLECLGRNSKRINLNFLWVMLLLFVKQHSYPATNLLFPTISSFVKFNVRKEIPPLPSLFIYFFFLIRFPRKWNRTTRFFLRLFSLWNTSQVSAHVVFTTITFTLAISVRIQYLASSWFIIVCGHCYLFKTWETRSVNTVVVVVVVVVADIAVCSKIVNRE